MMKNLPVKNIRWWICLPYMLLCFVAILPVYAIGSAMWVVYEACSIIMSACDKLRYMDADFMYMRKVSKWIHGRSEK